jgi:uncharacterized protein (DUF58 family)
VSASRRSSSPEALARIKRLGLRARHAVQGTLNGLNHSPYKGSSVEFADYREYVPGDDLRRLDWRIYARTGRHVIKEFEEETNLRATFLLDASASMRYGALPGVEERWSKFDYASTLTATLATLLVTQRDCAGLLLFDEAARHYLRPASTQLQVRKICETLEGTEPERQTQLGEVIARAADEIPRRGLIFIVSDLLTDLDAFFASLGRLKNRAHEIVLVHVLDRDELELPFEGSINFRDLEGSEQLMAEPRFFRDAYKQAMRDFCEGVEARAANFGSDYIQLCTDQDLGPALAYYLARRQRLSGAHRGGAAARAAAMKATGGRS